MIKIDQTIVDPGRGDCLRACIASIFDLEIVQVPHFVLFSDKQWFNVYYQFIGSLGYEWQGTGWPVNMKLSDSPTVGGFIIASVPSKSYEGITHAVIVNSKGLVVHDPNPNKKWQYVNVKETGDLQHWEMIGTPENEQEERIDQQT